VDEAAKEFAERQLNILRQNGQLLMEMTTRRIVPALARVPAAIYRIRLDYRFQRRPRVRVLSPELERYNDEDIPHMYGQKYLCLYLPGVGDWSPDKEIAKTIIPWAALWLNYYELWHATGEWLGGGHDPSDDEDAMQREVVVR
jgi:hypothetical protein